MFYALGMLTAIGILFCILYYVHNLLADTPKVIVFLLS